MPDCTSRHFQMPGAVVCAFLVLTITGCYSHRAYPWAPVAVSGAGWTAYTGQGVWKPMPQVPELAGDVFVALNTNGEAFIQFSKTLPFLTAQLDEHHWEVNIPSQKKVYSGGRHLPSHFAWIQLPALLRQEPPTRPWLFTGDENHWQIENPKTGETLSGYLNPP